MMAERGLSLAHTTIMRWVWRYAPEFEKRRRQSNSIRRRVARHARSQATIYAARARHSVNAIERLSL
jgi:transposase-like protein